jgi:large subunit ribosomal protein L28
LLKILFISIIGKFYFGKNNMSYVCEICGKKSSMGRSQKHRRGVAGKRWRSRAQATPRLFVPNLQRVSLVVSGEKKQMRICTKCLKRIKKYHSIGKYKSISVSTSVMSR